MCCRLLSESTAEALNLYTRELGVPPLIQWIDVYGIEPDFLAMILPPVIAVVICVPPSVATGVSLKKDAEPPRGTGVQPRARTNRVLHIPAVGAAAVAAVPVESTEIMAAASTTGAVVRKNVVFIEQLNPDAGCTIAAIHALSNNAAAIGLPLDSPISLFVSECKSWTPRSAAYALAGALDINPVRTAQSDDSCVRNQSDNIFICFTTVGGDLYELDGCKALPVNHGPLRGRGSVLCDSAAAISKAIFWKDKKFNETDLSFPESFRMTALVDLK